MLDQDEKLVYTESSRLIRGNTYQHNQRTIVMSRTRRTPAETAIDLRAKLAKAEAAARMDEAKSNPLLSPLADAVENARDQRTVLSRKRSGPQSFDNRRAKHTLWIDQINCEEDLNVADTEATVTLLEQLDSALSDLADKIAEGIGVSPEEVELCAETEAQTFPGLETAVLDSQQERKNFGKKESVPFDECLENEAGA